MPCGYGSVAQSPARAQGYFTLPLSSPLMGEDVRGDARHSELRMLTLAKVRNLRKGVAALLSITKLPGHLPL